MILHDATLRTITRGVFIVVRHPCHQQAFVDFLVITIFLAVTTTAVAGAAPVAAYLRVTLALTGN